jgi:hypothetical protein
MRALLGGMEIYYMPPPRTRSNRDGRLDELVFDKIIKKRAWGVGRAPITEISPRACTQTGFIPRARG